MRFIIEVLRPFARWLCRVWFDIEFRGVENVPREGAVIITPNHVTYADPIWITIPVRRRVYYMAWDRMFRIPVLGFLMRVFGAFPVRLEGSDASARREANELLAQGRALVIFPEGGRAKDGKLMPFKQGAFRLALTHGIQILPVTIDGGYEIWPVGRVFPRAGKLVITYHPPIPVERAEEDLSRAEMKERARALAGQAQQSVASALPRSSLATDAQSSVLTPQS
ncbi:MAG TPA: lysophospholipid acyltransferase family protein [Blastocatellia bacterium]|nr:lysophospholipid acyltransferase family protein [Blastocatellia bacterium]